MGVSVAEYVKVLSVGVASDGVGAYAADVVGAERGVVAKETGPVFGAVVGAVGKVVALVAIVSLGNRVFSI